MGNATSAIKTAGGAASGWKPAVPGATQTRISKAGFNITPLTIEQREQLAKTGVTCRVLVCCEC